MNCQPTRNLPAPLPRGFSLVEMLVVIAIISILMTAGSIGLSNLGGRGVTSGVDTCEALVDEARGLAIGKNLRSALLVAKNLDNNPAENLRRVLVAHEQIGADGSAANPDNPQPNWELTSRGALLPEQTFYSHVFSQENHDPNATGANIDEIPYAKLVGAKSSYRGSYYIYEFNAQGMPKNPGTSFVIGTGSRILTKSVIENPPKVVASAKRDFGGFVIWRNGRTSVFRSPDQVSSQMTSIKPGDAF
jgi:prepilin-type N-terminal cleavage/methylation domain-containing protein